MEKTTTPTGKDIKEMNRKIDLLRTRAKVSADDASDAFRKQLRAAEDQFELVKARFEKMGTQASEATNEMKNGLADSWSELKNSIEKATHSIH